MRAQGSFSVFPSSSRKHPESKLDCEDPTENTDSSSRDDDENQIEQICGSQLIRRNKTPNTDTRRSLLSSRAVVKNKKGSYPSSQFTLDKDELVRESSSRGGRRNSTSNLSGLVEFAELQQQQKPPKQERRHSLVFRSPYSKSRMKTPPGHELQKLSVQSMERKAPKRSHSVSRGENTTTSKTTQSGTRCRREFGASKPSNSVLRANFLQYSAAEWEDEYHKISALDSDDDDAVMSFKKRARESASPRRIFSRTRTDGSSPRRIFGTVSSSVMVGDEMWTQYDQITAGDADEKYSDFELTNQEGKENKKNMCKPSSKFPKKSEPAPKDPKKLSTRKRTRLCYDTKGLPTAFDIRMDVKAVDSSFKIFQNAIVTKELA